MAHPAPPVSGATVTPDRSPNISRGVAEVVERFAEAWRASDTPPDLPAYLPDSPAIRRVSLIELIKVDLANRWMRGAEPKRLSQYVEDLPELGTWPLPPDLIYEEFHVRRRAGSSVEVAEYTAAYPEQADQLSEMLATDDYRSTLVAGAAEPANLDDIEVGQKIDDFDLMGGLGRGAFARVFLARQRTMQRLVAVKISQDKSAEPQTLAQLDHDYIVHVQTCFALWALSGIVVPVSVQLSGNQLSAEAYVHFFITQIVCGAIAMAYPYFLVTFYAVRSLYPMFLPHGGLGAQDARQLEQLDRASTYFLVVAAAVPLLGVAGATFIPPQDLPAVIIALRVLCVASTLAFVGVYWLFHMLEQDLAALQRIVSRG
ncbi:hypothetical protein ACLMAL_37730 [Nocardia sp. CWNU-33]|uniref:hypothetical protein n=1 Tax=Nocardia sp. CWNU-33 TaxID=3392117 RepID=UPI00398ECFBB